MKRVNLIASILSLCLMFLVSGNSLESKAVWISKLVAMNHKISTTRQSLSIDSKGYLHIVYGGDHLYYVKYKNGILTKKVIDNSNFVGFKPIISVDSNDNPHVVYLDAYGNLKYALFRNSSWKSTTIGYCKGFCAMSLFIDSNNNPQVAYYFKRKIIYLTYDGQKWLRNIINPPKELLNTKNFIMHISNKNIYIAYLTKNKSSDYQLKYAYYSGSNWKVTSIDKGGISSLFSFKVGSDNLPHIAYYSYEKKNIYYAYLENKKWNVERVTGVSGVNDGKVILSLDKKNNPGIVFSEPYGFSSNFLKYAHKSGGQWTVDVLKQKAYTEYYVCSMSADEKGAPFILSEVYKGTGIYFLYIIDGEDSWSETLLTEESLIYGGYPFAIDSQGNPHLIFWNFNGRYELMYAYYNGSDWVFSKILDVQGNSDGHPSLSLDSLNKPHVAYTDDKGVGYAYFTGKNWFVESVDYNIKNNWNNFTKIVLDSSGTPYIVYYDLPSIKYAVFDGSVWRKTTVSGDGRFSNAFVNKSGVLIIPFISYQKGNLLIKVARCEGNSCTPNTFYFGTENNKLHPEVTVDSRDIPHLIYYDSSDGTLKYATFDNNKWKIEKVDSIKGGIIDWLKDIIKVDSKNKPHILYDTRSNLKYAYYSGKDWKSENVTGYTDEFSMVIDNKNLPHIVYKRNGGLYYSFKQSNSEAVFSDVSSNDWYYNSVMDIYTHNITTGYPDGTFKPGNYVTRAQMAAFLARAMKINVKAHCTNSPFKDVSKNEWYCPYVDAIKIAEITQGVGGGYYDPDGYVTRAQMAAFLSKALDLSIQPCKSEPFSDVSTDAWYCPYVQAIKNANLTTGYPDGTYRPDGYVTRAEMAVFLERGFLQ